jgi:hypothetical protein
MTLNDWTLNTYIAQTNGRVNALHGNDDIVERSSNISLGEEAALDQGVGLGWPFTHEMIKETWRELVPNFPSQETGHSLMASKMLLSKGIFF